MRKKCIILVYFLALIVVIATNPTVSSAYNQSQEDITQYIIDISKNIESSIQKPELSVLYSSKGEVKLKLLLSPWGELKDVYISESSGNKDLDNLCLKTVWMHKRYQPFPEKLGDKDLWMDVPIIFDIDSSRPGYLENSKPRSNNILRTEAVDSGLNEAIDTALENHRAIKIAEQEMELAGLKIREARRALYPAASLNYSETTGTTTGMAQDFTDKEYKLKFEYPLYYGWRLKYAVDQSISNMKASQASYEKTLQELRLGVETAFYSYAAARMGMSAQKSLLTEVTPIFERAKKRFDIGLSTKAEFMQVQTQIRQIEYQIISSENEFKMAKLNLAQAMNIGEDSGMMESITIDAEKDMRPVDPYISMEDCLKAAFISRPDLKQKEYMVESSDYERKINESKNQLKVDLTGSYGKSGGAYETEPLMMGNDWYMGFKVSKPLGGNTLSTSYTKDKTSQKHGQSTRTGADSKSIELGLLDSMQLFSEIKSSEIGLEKAKDELQQTKDNIMKEVKDAYLSYKKGLSQTTIAIDKIKYKEEELKIAKARAELNDIAISELIQAYVGLTDEKSYYIDALASLYQSLAKLNKAAGYSLFLDDENFKLANVNR